MKYFLERTLIIFRKFYKLLNIFKKVISLSLCYNYNLTLNKSSKIW